jgi:hypothetical protein
MFQTRLAASSAHDIMHKINKTAIIRWIVALSLVALGSSSSLRSSINNSDIEQSSYSHQHHSSSSARLLQSDGQQPTNTNSNGSTLVVVGAVGAVLSVLVFIGGVCYAKRQYSSDNDGPKGAQYLNDTMEEKEIGNIISSMEKNAAKKEKGGGAGGYFKRGSSKGASGTTTSSNHNGRATADDDEELGYESDVPPPPPQGFMNDEQPSDDDESDMLFMSNNRVGAGNKSVADNTSLGDDMSFAYSVDQSSIAPYNRQGNQAIDPYIGGAALQSFKDEKGGVFEWNEDGTKMVYTPAMGDDDKRAQNGFVYDERKKKWVVSKQVVGAKGVSFKPTTSANDGKSAAMMMKESPKEIQRTHSDVSSKSNGSGATGFSGYTGLGSEFTFNAVGTDYSTVRTRSGTTFVSTGIAIPSQSAEAVEVEGVTDIDRLMLTDSEEFSDGSSTDGHIAGEHGDEEPGMIVPKKTIGRLKNNTTSIKEETPFDEGGPGRIGRPKPVPNFDNTSRQIVRRNRKPSFGRRV